MALCEGKHKRIIVMAVDDDRTSHYTFDYYCREICKEGDKLILIYVPENYFMRGAEEKVRQLKAEAMRITALEKSYTDKMVVKQIQGTFRVGVGNKPGHVIVRVAQEEKADLVMIGDRDETKSRFGATGNVCKFVVHNSPIPVMVCRGATRNRTPITMKTSKSSTPQ